MEENNNSTVDTEVVETEGSGSGEQPEVVDQEETQKDFELVEDQEKTDAEQSEVVDQTKDDNHKAKLARQRAERDARKREEERQAKEDEEWASVEAINPITGEPFRSKKEFFEYNAEVKKANQQKRAEAAGKTVTEVAEEDADRDYIRKKRQEESRQSSADFFKEDLEAFMDEHPEVDVEALDNNKTFREFCGSRYGKEPLSSLYESYQKLVKNAERSFKADTRTQRSTGSGANGGERMTAEQKRNLDAWNEAYPNMKMTPSEFLKQK